MAQHVWWALRIQRRLWTPILIGIALAAGFLDVSGIFLFVTRVPGRDEAAYRQAALLTAGWATALYSLAGALLTLNTRGLSRLASGVMWCCWIGGFGLWLSTLTRFAIGVYLSITVNWALLPCVCAVVGSHYSRHRK